MPQTEAPIAETINALLAPACSRVVDVADHDTWLAARRTGIGASEIAAVLGLDPWRGPLEVWVEKTQKVLFEREETEPMRLGKRLEPFVVEEFALRSGLPVMPSRTLFRSLVHPWLVATPDGIAIADGGELATIEGKLVGARMTPDWADGPPLYVQAQAAHQAITLGARCGYVAALLTGLEGTRFESYPFEVTKEIEELILEAGAAFWRLVETGEQPPSDGMAGDTLARLFPRETGATVDLGERGLELDAVRAEAVELIERGKNLREKAENGIKELIKDATWGALPNGARYSLKTVRRKGYTVAPCEYRQLHRHD